MAGQSWQPPLKCLFYFCIYLSRILYLFIYLIFFKCDDPFIYLFIYLFIFGCVGSSFLCEGFLQLRRAGATLHHGARASHYRGLSCWEHKLQTRRLSNCGSRAQLLRGMWDLLRPGLKPVSPALAGRLSTTVPPGKPYKVYFNIQVFRAQFGELF